MTDSSTKLHEIKQKLESADVCVARDHPLTCIFFLLHFYYYFREFSCVSWLNMYSLVPNFMFFMVRKFLLLSVRTKYGQLQIGNYFVMFVVGGTKRRRIFHDGSGD